MEVVCVGRVGSGRDFCFWGLRVRVFTSVFRGFRDGVRVFIVVVDYVSIFFVFVVVF